jgi:type I restriction enzyme, S subunit
VKRARVGDVIELQRRKIEVDPLETYEEIGVRSFGKGIFHKEPVIGAVLGSKRMFTVCPGDLVFNNVFAWEGAVALAGSSKAGMCGSHRFLTYTARDSDVDLAFLRYFFISEPGLAALGSASPGSAGRNRTLAIDRFENLEVPLPDASEQRRIVARLETLLGQTSAVGRHLKASDPGRIVAIYPGTVERTLAREAAHWTSVGDVVDFVNDLVRPGEPTEPAKTFVGLQHIESHTGRRTGSIPLGSEKGRKFRFQPGDIVYGYLRPYLNKVWVADTHGLCSVDQYVLRPKTGIPASYLAHSLRSRSTLEQAIAMTHSLQLPRLRSGLLASIEIPVVSPERVREVTEALDLGLSRIVEARILRVRQANLIDGLTKSALNGAFAGLH